MASEHSVQNTIRNAIADHCHAFRVNVGTGWTGDARRLPNGNVLIANPRPLSSGLPAGFSDLFGWRTVEITEDMVGSEVAVFVALEVKSETGKASTQQIAFIDAVRRSGGLAGIVRSPEEALAVLYPTTPTNPETHAMTPTAFIEQTAQLGWDIRRTSDELGVTTRTVTNWRTGHRPIPRAVERLIGELLAKAETQHAQP